MRTIKLLPGCIIITALLCGMASADLTDVPLVWTPVNNSYNVSPATIAGYGSHKFKIMPFSDLRKDKEEIGRNIERGQLKLVTTKDDAGRWCADALKEIFRHYGLKLADTKETVILKGDIVKLHVTESSTYEATATVKMTARNSSGNVLWQGTINGNSKRFGRSYKLDNYYESLSEAYQDAVNGMLKNSAFRKALKAR
jgi:hypothetical protein